MRKYFLIIVLMLHCNLLNSQIDLMNVKPWAYQLQNVDISAISSDRNIRLVIIDYSSDGSDNGKFTKHQISEIKNSGKYAISYISIGEAEEYRSYWKPEWKSNPPEWLGPENPNWKGNYKVKFWLNDWQSIIFTYIDSIINQGFDGIYLDIIDAWYYWAQENPQKSDADSLMCSFVLNIRNHVNSFKGNEDFIIIPQNGEDVIYQQNVSDELRSSYFNAINAIGLEDVFFPGENEENNNYNPDSYRLGTINKYLEANKQAYSIEYLTEPAKISQYQQASTEKKIVPYSCIRPLNKMCPPLISGIEDNDLLNDYIRPSPAKDYIYYNSFSREGNRLGVDTYIRIFNILGECVMTLEQSQWSEQRIDVSQLPAGVYIIRLSIHSKIFIKY